MERTILLIEDNPQMSENVAGILKLANYNVLSAAEGKTGVQLALDHHPDLILCDILMPDLDGYSVFHILSKDPELSTIPFVFLSAKSEAHEVRFGMNLGADDYITKPFDGHDLLKVVDVRLKKNNFLKASFGNNLNDVNQFFQKAKELKEFNKLSDNRPVRKFKRKDFVYMEGQNPYELFFIVKGEVKSFMNTPDGKEIITGIYHAGDFFGYAPILEDCPHTDCAMVIDDTEIAIIPKDDFLSLIYSSRDIAKKFIKLLSNQVMDVEHRLLNLAYQSVRQRVAGALLSLMDKFSTPVKKSTITIARRDIANFIGTATETLNRTLADFKDEGLIDLTQDGIRIINRVKLEKMRP